METWRTGSRYTSSRLSLAVEFVDRFEQFQLQLLVWKNFSPLVIIVSLYFLHFQARNRSGQVGYVPEKYLQLPSSNSLLSMLQALAALDARSHSSSNSTEPETELPTGSVNGDSSGEGRVHQATACTARNVSM